MDPANLSAEATQKSFVTAARPRLIIRQVSVSYSQGRAYVRYAWDNVGGTPAYFFEESSTVRVLPELPMEVDYSKGRLDQHNPIKLDTAQFTGTSGVSIEPVDETLANNLQTGHGSQRLFAFGYVKYRDEVGTVHMTAFARVYDPISKRFVVIDNPDYKYQD